MKKTMKNLIRENLEHFKELFFMILNTKEFLSQTKNSKDLSSNLFLSKKAEKKIMKIFFLCTPFFINCCFDCFGETIQGDSNTGKILHSKTTEITSRTCFVML